MFHAIVTLIVAAAAAVATWTYQDVKMAAAIATINQEAMQAAEQERMEAREIQRVVTKNYEEALNDARVRETTLRADRDALRATAERLRRQSAAATSRLAVAPPAAVLEYATALNDVFADCREAYAGMVAVADGHASDVRTLTEAWPVTDAKESP